MTRPILRQCFYFVSSRNAIRSSSPSFATQHAFPRLLYRPFHRSSVNRDVKEWATPQNQRTERISRIVRGAIVLSLVIIMGVYSTDIVIKNSKRILMNQKLAQTRKYREYEVIGVIDLSPTTKLYTLKRPDMEDRKWYGLVNLTKLRRWFANFPAEGDEEFIKDPFKLEPISSLLIKNPTLEIERSYTPLFPTSEDVRELQILVKKYDNGDVSTYIHGKPVGETLWVKENGRSEWKYRAGEWNHVIFVAGGTGIAPLCQLVPNLLAETSSTIINEDEYDGDSISSPRTKLTVLYSARSEDEILFKTQFDSVQKEFSDRFRIRYFVDSDGGKTGFLTSALPSNVSKGPIKTKDIKNAMKWAEIPKTIVIVSGPDGFIEYVSGPKGVNYKIQGKKGGLTAESGAVNVWKMLG